ncbi:MAG: hypothetical protein IJL96_04370, partial [Clostridia bacterium]|nr:hypothetical protein [Clostridia bacterium]
IDGIGDKQLETIRNIIAEFMSHLMDYTGVRMSPDDPSDQNLALIRAIYQYIHGRNLRKNCAAILGELRGFIQYAASADAARNTLSWFFSGSERRNRTIMFAREVSDFAGGRVFDAAREISDKYDEALNADDMTCLRYFRGNSADFYAVFESLCAGSLPKPLNRLYRPAAASIWRKNILLFLPMSAAS